METIERKIEELIPAEYNPRQMTEKQNEDLKASLKRFGVVEPILINMHKDRKNIIIGGHQRLRVWKSLGNDTIPCVEIKVNRDRERELNIRLNKNTGEFDWDALKNEFDIGDLEDWGFDADDLMGEDNMAVADGVEMEQVIQLPPTREYIVVMCDADSWQFDKLIDLLKLKNKRRGGYKRGSSFDQVAMERVIPASRIIALLDKESQT